MWLHIVMVDMTLYYSGGHSPNSLRAVTGWRVELEEGGVGGVAACSNGGQ